MNKAGLILVAIAMLAGCSRETASESSAAIPASEIAAPGAVAAEVGVAGKDVGGIMMFDLAPVTIGPYTVQPMYEDKLEDGHFNLRISGGEVAAVREWVGPEDAFGVMVVKTEIERDYHHGHVEMPTPIPADARLWIEIESPSGELFKGSTPVK
jgi:hypothetical protein